MSAAPPYRARPAAEPGIAVAAVVMLAAGTVLALTGAAAGSLPLAVTGGGAAAAAIVTLVAADWLDGTIVVALSLPLPALYSAGDLRLTTAAPATAAVLLAWTLRWGADAGRLDLGAFPRRAAGGLIGAALVTTLFSQYRFVSVREVLNLGVLFAFLIGATAAFAREPRRIPRAVAALALLGAVCGVLGVLETLTILPGRFPRGGTPFNRAALGFGQPNALGLFFAIVLPFAVHGFTTARGAAARWAAALAAGAIALGLFGTFSRGSWLSLLGGTAALLWAGDRRFVARIWLCTLVAAVVLDVVSGGALRETVQRTIGDWVIEQRAALMLAGILMFLAHPFFGVGPGGYAESLDRFGAQIPWLWDYLPTPHNAYVQMAAETGLFGLIAFSVFLGATLLLLIRSARSANRAPETPPEEASLRRALLWSFATICCAGFVVWPFAHGTGQAVMIVAAAAYAMESRAVRAAGGPAR